MKNILLEFVTVGIKKKKKRMEHGNMRYRLAYVLTLLHSVGRIKACAMVGKLFMFIAKCIRDFSFQFVY